jgi:EAL domain-containing protein (putative c-di-GMP-specific phosphodiesterase class I)
MDAIADAIYLVDRSSMRIVYVNLWLGVIAEGVEAEAQRDFLAASGCHAYQGYFFSRPLQPVAFENLVKQARSAAP